jgi:hypothetical protein
LQQYEENNARMGETNFQNKTNHDVDAELKKRIKPFFHHLTKMN